METAIAYSLYDFLSQYKWYRKRKKGNWHEVKFNIEDITVSGWIRTEGSSAISNSKSLATIIEVVNTESY